MSRSNARLEDVDLILEGPTAVHTAVRRYLEEGGSASEINTVLSNGFEGTAALCSTLVDAIRGVQALEAKAGGAGVLSGVDVAGLVSDVVRQTVASGLSDTARLAELEKTFHESKRQKKWVDGLCRDAALRDMLCAAGRDRPDSVFINFVLVKVRRLVLEAAGHGAAGLAPYESCLPILCAAYPDVLRALLRVAATPGDAPGGDEAGVRLLVEACKAGYHVTLYAVLFLQAAAASSAAPAPAAAEVAAAAAAAAAAQPVDAGTAAAVLRSLQRRMLAERGDYHVACVFPFDSTAVRACLPGAELFPADAARIRSGGGGAGGVKRVWEGEESADGDGSDGCPAAKAARVEGQEADEEEARGGDGRWRAEVCANAALVEKMCVAVGRACASGELKIKPGSAGLTDGWGGILEETSRYMRALGSGGGGGSGSADVRFVADVAAIVTEVDDVLAEEYSADVLLRHMKTLRDVVQKCGLAALTAVVGLCELLRKNSMELVDERLLKVNRVLLRALVNIVDVRPALGVHHLLLDTLWELLVELKTATSSQVEAAAYGIAATYSVVAAMSASPLPHLKMLLSDNAQDMDRRLRHFLLAMLTAYLPPPYSPPVQQVLTRIVASPAWTEALCTSLPQLEPYLPAGASYTKQSLRQILRQHFESEA